MRTDALGWCSTLWGWGPCLETPFYFLSGQMSLLKEVGLQEETLV